jgi:hypothetical protein
MNYTVLWMPIAEQRLAAIWTDVTDRNDVTRAVHEIDRILRFRPEAAGESRLEDVRILLEKPLGILFTVSPPDRSVSVLTVWRFETPPKTK